MAFAKQLLTAATVSLILLAAGCSDSSSDAGTAPVTTNDGNTSSGGDTNNDSTDDSNTGSDDSGTVDNSGSDTNDSGNSSGGSGSDNDNGTGTSDNTDTDNSGGNNSGSGGDDDTGTVDPVACQSTTHLGQPFQTAQGSDSDPVFHSALAADGCLDASSVWSGDSGDVLVLDTGTPQPMQGIYVWPRYNQLNWLEVSTSPDGTNWTTEWQAIPTRPEQGPQYLSFKQPRSLRWVRIKGLKGQLNDWVNISEVRWSLTGENVTVAKALRSGTGADMTKAPAFRVDLATWSVHPRLSMTRDIAGLNMGQENCAFQQSEYESESPIYIWTDLYGLQDSVYKRTDLPGNIIAFSYDWSHLTYPDDYNVDPQMVYGPSAFPPDGAASRATRVLHEQISAWKAANIPAWDQQGQMMDFCLSSGAHSDTWLGYSVGWFELLEGISTPDFSAFR